MLPERYEDRGILGDGAMGEVRRVRDRRLGTDVAMKILHAELANREAVRSRFEAEGRMTARLRHPGIVAVHDLGRLADGRSWFTMQVVEGRTFRDLINEAHAGGRPPPGPVLERLLGVVADVADALAYAHGEGVVHRDLKPSNVMVGAFGEVLLMDWGVAKGPDLEVANWEGLQQAPSRHRTMIGRAVGTPPYMSPEQARAEADRVGPWSDVYALGALLYKVISGRSPYRGEAAAVLEMVRRGPPLPLREVCRGTLSDDLEALVGDCLRREPERRPAGAEELARRLRAWLDGERRRERAMGLVRDAMSLADDLAEARAVEVAAGNRVTARADEARRGGGNKDGMWAALDEQRVAARRLRQLERRYTQALRAALFEVPDLPEARARLADLYRARAEAAVAAGGTAAAEITQLQLVDDGRHRSWIQGEAWITLVTSPPGVRVEAFRLEDRAGRREPVRVGSIGNTPLMRLPLGAGSWLLELQVGDGLVVRYPILLGRLEHLVVRRPGDATPTPVVVPDPTSLRTDEVYVPPGWTRIGGAPALDSFPARRVWVDGFITAADLVTEAEWTIFLDHCVRTRQSTEGLELTGPSAPDAPVWVSGGAMRRYVAWRAAWDGLPWRLMHEFEWEKLARGADGRRFPWGDREDPAFFAAPDGRLASQPSDGASIYGVRGLTARRERLGNPWEVPEPEDGAVVDSAVEPASTPGSARYYAVRGGAGGAPRYHAACRLAYRPDLRTGPFRVARSFP